MTVGSQPSHFFGRAVGGDCSRQMGQDKYKSVSGVGGMARRPIQLEQRHGLC